MYTFFHEKGGVVLISEETADRLQAKFSRKAEERQHKIIAVAPGTIEQLHDLVKLVATNEVSHRVTTYVHFTKLIRRKKQLDSEVNFQRKKMHS